MRYILFTFIVQLFVLNSFGSEKTKELKHVLMINSFHRGFMWTDSVTIGEIRELKKDKSINYFVHYLNSKYFGQANFEIEKAYLKTKFAGVKIDGVLANDNDALDFAIKFKDELFPESKIVFAGISNPEQYPLKELSVYGIKESSNNELALDYIMQLMPGLKRLLVLVDKSTSGVIYRDEILEQAKYYQNLKVTFPEVFDTDSIFNLVASENQFDAIFYLTIGSDNKGTLIDYSLFGEEVIRLAKKPVFCSSPIFMYKGVIGGLYHSGKKHGHQAGKMLVDLLHGHVPKLLLNYGTTINSYFADNKVASDFGITLKNLPAEVVIINKPNLLNKKNFFILLMLIFGLIILILVLSLIIKRVRNEKNKSQAQLRIIEEQKRDIEISKGHLKQIIGELELTNQQLVESNQNLAVAKKKAEESDKLKSAFLANVSHEIRTPLNSIVGFSSLLDDPDLSEEARNGYIRLIESNTESLLVLIDEIIDLSKIEAQQLNVKKQLFNLDQLFDEECKIFEQNNENDQVEIKVSKPAGDQFLFIESDRTRVKQIFTNLLSNALKFTASGMVEFGYVFDKNREVVFFVKDTGIGISKEYHQAIFQRFRKLNDDSNKVFRGTGLGLAITQKLVGLLGGNIWLESEPGKGTSFYFTLAGVELRNLNA